MTVGSVKIAALIPAAGGGTRLGLGPKAFVEVAGRSLLARSVDALAGQVDEVLVALPEGMKLPGGVKARSVTGGATRQESVFRLLAATEAEVVLVHDAARPFLPPEVIRRVLAAVAEVGAATVALPCPDTLVRGTEGHWDGLLSREQVWTVQTPQGFRRGLLLEAHERARSEGFAGTDDASLVARLGHGVALVQGDARLFKLTRPDDLLLARALAAVWDAEQEGVHG